MFTALQYRLLKWICPGEPTHMDGSAYAGKSKLGVLLGEDLLARVRGKKVIDFGCGDGSISLDLARRGARQVVGLDIRESVLQLARERAAREGLAGICRFAGETEEKADIVVSIDAFEHFDDPAAELRHMDRLLVVDGEILASFGPTWRHPYGGHLVSVFPWAHLLFTEKALMRWRAGIRSDGATRFSEVEGGQNQMTIRRFERLVEASPFCFAWMETVPIRKLAFLHNRWTREFTTSTVRCRLVKRAR